MILCTRLVELTKINLLWLLCCLPVLLALLLGFVWLICGFALMCWYDITVIE